MKEDFFRTNLRKGDPVRLETAMGKMMGTYLKVEGGYVFLTDVSRGANTDTSKAVLRCGSIRSVEWNSNRGT